MGNSDAETPAKAPKASSSQEQPPISSSNAGPVYPDWSSFQAYSPIPPHGFFPSPVASSPQGHPYMWGAQHMMPPYGTPPPFVMYPHGGLYAHPSLPPGSHPFSPYAMPSPSGNPEGSGAVSVGAEGDGKSIDGKERSPLKRSKGSLGSLNMITGKNNNEPGKSGVPANGVFSQSGESGSEDSSEGSDANSQNDSQPKASGGHDSFEADGTQNDTAARGSQNGAARPPSQILNEPMPIMPMPCIGTPGAIAGPTTNLNIGMDYWGTPNPSPVVPMRSKISGASGVGGLTPTGVGGPRENIPSDLWIQDERELKRQRRKQSNRESARRSRLRKQAECEELAQRVEVLNGENAALKAQVNQMRNEYEQLLSENTSLKEKFGNIPRGTDDSRVEKNNLLSADDNNKKNIDSDTQDGQADAVQNGS